MDATTGPLHRCPVAGCGSILPYDKLMCYRHWSKVPRSVQQQVYTAWNRGIPTPSYPAIRAMAVELAEGASQANGRSYIDKR